jgi:hypothetical protein
MEIMKATPKGFLIMIMMDLPKAKPTDSKKEIHWDLRLEIRTGLLINLYLAIR